MRAMTSTYHLMMRFPTDHGVGEVSGDQTMVWECYSTLLLYGLQEETLMVSKEEVKEKKVGPMTKTNRRPLGVSLR